MKISTCVLLSQLAGLLLSILGLLVFDKFLLLFWLLAVWAVNSLMLLCYVVFPIIKVSTGDIRSQSRFKEYAEIQNKLSSLKGMVLLKTDELEQAVYYSEHDGLTGCLNRVGFNRRSIAYKDFKDLLVLSFDVNNLKRLNDLYGHEAGDALIKTATSKLRFWESHGGDLYRMGGDEFLVVMSDKTQREYKALLAEWRSMRCQLNRVSDEFKCVLAMGYAMGDDFDSLLRESDEQMYINKSEIKETLGEACR